MEEKKKKDINLPPGVVHVEKETVRFFHRGKVIDLRESDPAFILAAAKDQYCKVLQYNAGKEAKETPAAEAIEAPKAGKADKNDK